MTIYYIMYAIMTAVALIVQYLSKDLKYRSRIICSFGFILVFLILALRHWSMGVDLGYYSIENVGYLQSFEKLNEYSWGEILKMKEYLNYERGYIIFNKFIGSINNNKQFFLGVCAFINMSTIAIYIYKKSYLPLLSWIIFLGLPVFLLFFSGMRQDIAISITILSMYWIEKKRPIPFILTVLFAWLFHKSAILFLIAYPMYYVKLTDLQKFIFALMIPVVFALKVPLFSVLSKLLKDNVETESTGAGMLFLIFSAIYIALLLLNNYHNKKQNELINLFYIACICQAFSGLYSIAIRVGYYFMIYLSIALPNTIYEFQFGNGRRGRNEFVISYMVIFTAFLLFGIYSIKYATWACTNPYVFFWEKP